MPHHVQGHSRVAQTDRVATVGVAEHGNAAELVTVTTDGELIDRRHLELTEPGMPTHPHHHEGSWAVGRYLKTPGARRISLPEAVALVERVRTRAEQGARDGLAGLAAAVPSRITRVALRAFPALPATTEERIADHRAQTFADSAMYREAIATAARERGWEVFWYARERVFADAATTLSGRDLDALLRAMSKAAGPPWQAAHKLAAAAAIYVANIPRDPAKA